MAIYGKVQTVVHPAIMNGVAEEQPIALTLDDVGYEFADGNPTIKDLSLSVRTGEIIGVVGPSGCGKSTLLRLIAGLLKPTHGSIEVQLEEDDVRPKVMMMFQQDTLAPWLRVRDNVMLYYRFHPKGKAEAKVRSQELLESTGVGDAASLYPYQLSGGMRRRVAFATTLVPNPYMLLLDEPFSAVDEPTRVAIHQSVHKTLRQYGVTAFLVTHDLAEAVSLSDRVVILSNRPASVINIYEIDLGYDRNIYDVRDNPQFLELYGTLWECLSGQLKLQNAELSDDNSSGGS